MLDAQSCWRRVFSITATGVALITVDSKGENTIVVASGELVKTITLTKQMIRRFLKKQAAARNKGSKKNCGDNSTNDTSSPTVTTPTSFDTAWVVLQSRVIDDAPSDRALKLKLATLGFLSHTKEVQRVHSGKDIQAKKIIARYDTALTDGKLDVFEFNQLVSDLLAYQGGGAPLAGAVPNEQVRAAFARWLFFVFAGRGFWR